MTIVLILAVIAILVLCMSILRFHEDDRLRDKRNKGNVDSYMPNGQNNMPNNLDSLPQGSDVHFTHRLH